MTTKAIPQTEWEWFGNHGHFICGRWCRFHLCTKVGKYLISTVGEYVHAKHSQGSEQIDTAWVKDNYPGKDIGAGRKYETMVFLAGERCRIEECGCGLPKIIFPELYMLGYNKAGCAAAGHLKACKEFASQSKQQN